MEADLGTLSTTSGSIKRSAGRVIRIINNLDHSVQVSPESRGAFSAHFHFSMAYLLFRPAHVINNAQKYFWPKEGGRGFRGKIAPRALHFPQRLRHFRYFRNFVCICAWAAMRCANVLIAAIKARIGLQYLCKFMFDYCIRVPERPERPRGL